MPDNDIDKLESTTTCVMHDDIFLTTAGVI